MNNGIIEMNILIISHNTKTIGSTSMIESNFKEAFTKEWDETQITDWANELAILRQVISWQAIITQLTEFYSQ
jgi:hypothetical protein